MRGDPGRRVDDVDQLARSRSTACDLAELGHALGSWRIVKASRLVSCIHWPAPSTKFLSTPASCGDLGLGGGGMALEARVLEHEVEHLLRQLPAGYPSASKLSTSRCMARCFATCTSRTQWRPWRRGGRPRCRAPPARPSPRRTAGEATAASGSRGACRPPTA